MQVINTNNNNTAIWTDTNTTEKKHEQVKWVWRPVGCGA
jgi:hypothetical protein